ncbi:MAG TPA: hypothetical protein VD862_03930 [Candidatus Paceibacterota bacterium]|nr:hypothetical protein [Candidatus Paceibacterota bacterium]
MNNTEQTPFPRFTRAVDAFAMFALKAFFVGCMLIRYLLYGGLNLVGRAQALEPSLMSSLTGGLLIAFCVWWAIIVPAVAYDRLKYRNLPVTDMHAVGFVIVLLFLGTIGNALVAS